MKWLRKEKESKTSGKGAKAIKGYIYANQLSFLRKVTDLNETSSSLDGSLTEEGGAYSETEPVETTVSTKKRKLDEVETRVLQALERPKEPPNHHMAFFQGLIPVLNTLTVEQTFHFQSLVMKDLQLVKQPHFAHSSPTFTNASQPSSSGFPRPWESA